ncbi:hypothetical protein FA95DRAFT_968028 [Auriscalpium vulgare]|uniref:Uncharacterized protein n=1 Tax=Auriscalpium vulgare TaxID=40419 RepID=A0ACB8R770_9AGAM|nr:hypothetical protein FA95DRAFT_968028 [Auriscalpium vulgare]
MYWATFTAQRPAYPRLRPHHHHYHPAQARQSLRVASSPALTAGYSFVRRARIDAGTIEFPYTSLHVLYKCKKEAQVACITALACMLCRNSAQLVRNSSGGAGETSALPLAALSIVENTVPFPDAVPSLTRHYRSWKHGIHHEPSS